MLAPKWENTMNNRIKMTDSKFKCNIFLFLSVTVFMARLSILWLHQGGECVVKNKHRRYAINLFRNSGLIVWITYMDYLYIIGSLSVDDVCHESHWKRVKSHKIKYHSFVFITFLLVLFFSPSATLNRR
jgi:hypothetical protein